MKVWMGTHESGVRKAAGSDGELRDQIGAAAQQQGLTGNWSICRADIGDTNKEKILTILAGGNYIQEVDNQGTLVANPDGTVRKLRGH